MLKIPRTDIIERLLTVGTVREELSAEKMAMMSTEDLVKLLSRVESNSPQSVASQHEMIDDDGQTITLPKDDNIQKQEIKNAQRLSKTIPKQPRVEVPAEIVIFDPTQTEEWKTQVHLSERFAGLRREPLLEAMNVLAPAPAPPRFEEGIIPGADFLRRSQSSESLLQTLSSLHRPGSGPCPRTAGNLDCNRDCAGVDAKTIDALREANQLADNEGQAAANTIGAGVIDLNFKMPSPTPSVSPSASPSAVWVSNTFIKGNHTFVQEGDITVSVDNILVHIPKIGFYKDPYNNRTYKIVGDKVTLTTTAAKFVGMVSNVGAPPSPQKKAKLGKITHQFDSSMFANRARFQDRNSKDTVVSLDLLVQIILAVRKGKPVVNSKMVLLVAVHSKWGLAV
jgi:hypothetical protein